ncbi:MAG: hypothetical protein ACREJM_00025, partial [Candidatus Saccharimonadales bacterium]
MQVAANPASEVRSSQIHQPSMEVNARAVEVHSTDALRVTTQSNQTKAIASANSTTHVVRPEMGTATVITAGTAAVLPYGYAGGAASKSSMQAGDPQAQRTTADAQRTGVFGDSMGKVSG